MPEVKKRTEFTYWKRPWHKWIFIVIALTQLLCLWINIQEYNNILRAGILRASEWASYASQKQWLCAINGALMVCSIGIFLIGILTRSQKGSQLMEGLLLLFFALAWGAAGVVLHFFSLSIKGFFWFVMLLIAFGGAVHQLFQYHKE